MNQEGEKHIRKNSLALLLNKILLAVFRTKFFFAS